MSAAMTDMMMMILMLGGGYYLYQSGELDKLLGSSGGGGGSGGGGAARGSSTGNCSGGPYRPTGKTVSTSTRGPTTRHYASGKKDTTTIEKNAKGFSFQNYQFVSYVTIKKIDQDDSVSVKLGGRHMNGGWWDHGISFKSGKGCLGLEKKHPSTKSCIVTGKSIGSIIGRRIGVAGVVFRSTGKTELWVDQGKGWELLASGTNVGGFKPLSGKHEAQLRIDAAPGIEIHCSSVSEIGGGTPSAKSKQARIIPSDWEPPLDEKLLIPVESGIEYY